MPNLAPNAFQSASAIDAAVTIASSVRIVNCDLAAPSLIGGTYPPPHFGSRFSKNAFIPSIASGALAFSTMMRSITW